MGQQSSQPLTAEEARALQTQQLKEARDLQTRKQEALEQERQKQEEKALASTERSLREIQPRFEAALTRHMALLMKVYRLKPIAEFQFDIVLTAGDENFINDEKAQQLATLIYTILQKYLQDTYEKRGWHVVIGHLLNLNPATNLRRDIAIYPKLSVPLPLSGPHPDSIEVFSLRVYLSSQANAYVKYILLKQAGSKVYFDAWYQSPTSFYRTETCVVCHERPSTLRFVSCGHEAVCATCYKSLPRPKAGVGDLQALCPLCRIPIVLGSPKEDMAEEETESSEEKVTTSSGKWKQGDKVRIIDTKPIDAYPWRDGMDECLGQTGKIIVVYSDGDLGINFDAPIHHAWRFRSEWCRKCEERSTNRKRKSHREKLPLDKSLQKDSAFRRDPTKIGK